jgi:hypothetical protein
VPNSGWTLDQPGWTLDPTPEDQARAQQWSIDPLAPDHNKPTPLADTLNGQSETLPTQAQQLGEPAPTVIPSKNAAAKNKQLEQQQAGEDYSNEGWGDWALDKDRAFAGSAAEGVGSAIRGFGDFSERLYSTLSSRLGDGQAKEIIDHLFLPVARGTEAVGQGVADVGAAVGPGDRRDQFGNKLAGLFGSVGGFIASAAIAPETVAPELIGQGFDQVGQEMNARGGKKDTVSGLTAEAAGGAASAALMATGLGALTAKLSLPIKSAIVRGLAGIAIRSGADAATFAAQGIVVDLAGKLGVDPNTPVRDWPKEVHGVGENLEAGAILGAVFGGLMGPVPRHISPTSDALFGEPQPHAEAMARGAPLVTPEDHNSPLPTDLIQQGKGQAEIDLAHPENTKLPEGGTVGDLVDQAMPTKAGEIGAGENSNPQIPATFSPGENPPVGGGKPHLPPSIVQGLLDRGIPETAARAAGAGTVAEARGDPTAVNPDSGALGIGQWLGPRKEELIRRYGEHPTLDQQLDFLAWELKGGDAGGKAVLGAKDEQSALEAYITKFMRPAAGHETERDLKAGTEALGGTYAGIAEGERTGEPGLTKHDEAIQFAEQQAPQEEASAPQAPDELLTQQPESAPEAVNGGEPKNAAEELQRITDYPREALPGLIKSQERILKTGKNQIGQQLSAAQLDLVQKMVDHGKSLLEAPAVEETTQPESALRSTEAQLQPPSYPSRTS